MTNPSMPTHAKPPTPSSGVYNVTQWGGGYFDISSDGALDVIKAQARVPLASIVRDAQAQGLRLPMLLRFNHILHDRVRVLNAAFAEALQAHQGAYTPVYPIKVNQQRRVVEEIVSVCADDNPIGLEAGSKPELLAVLAKAPANSVIVCNGYKDAEFIRLALMGETLGHRVFIVIEKLSELPHIIAQSRALNIKPRLGLRVRLSNQGDSKWQNSGGEKAKFGLTAQQIFDALAQCEAGGIADCVTMLHFHLGSQVTDIAAIRRGIREAARYYVALRAQGVPIDYFDIGGGLGIDYEGTASSSYFSMNYSVTDYAQAVVSTLAEVCDVAQQPLPHIISESGRALTAHHAVLVSNVIEHERVTPLEQVVDVAGDDELSGLARLKVRLQSSRDVDVQHAYSALMHEVQSLHQEFVAGDLDMTVYARADVLYQQCLRLLQYRFPERPKTRALRQLKGHIQEVLADKLFLNFSVFQSTPDVWGISQIFPVLPLQALNRPADARAVIQDITCDSDGKISQYVDGAGVESTLPIPKDLAADELIGVFLIGAYQEILGDMHNLFGDTDSADVVIHASSDAQTGFEITDIIRGDTVSDVLNYVNFDAAALVETIKDKLAAKATADACESHVTDQADAVGYAGILTELLDSYTYLDLS